MRRHSQRSAFVEAATQVPHPFEVVVLVALIAALIAALLGVWPWGEVPA